MSRKLVVSFPGGQGSENPLLYFAAKHYENDGYEKIFVAHPISGECSLEALYENAKNIISKIELREFEKIVLIGKSLGSVVACKLKEEFELEASLVLFAPLQDTLPYIREDNSVVLVAAGENDRRLSSDILKATCEAANVKYYIEPNVGHRMEVKGNLDKDISIIVNVMWQLK